MYLVCNTYIHTYTEWEQHAWVNLRITLTVHCFTYVLVKTAANRHGSTSPHSTRGWGGEKRCHNTLVLFTWLKEKGNLLLHKSTDWSVDLWRGCWQRTLSSYNSNWIYNSLVVLRNLKNFYIYESMSPRKYKRKILSILITFRLPERVKDSSISMLTTSPHPPWPCRPWEK